MQGLVKEKERRFATRVWRRVRRVVFFWFVRAQKGVCKWKYSTFGEASFQDLKTFCYIGKNTKKLEGRAALGVRRLRILETKTVTMLQCGI